MDLFEAIKTRRSIRRYTPDSVDDAKIESILEAGRWAPSWANTQCWRFIVVRNNLIKTQIAESLMGTTMHDGVWVNPAAKAFPAAPVIIVVCGETGKSGYRHGDGGEPITDKGEWFMFDTALAVQNMVLAAHALGLGTVIIGAFNARQVEKVLDVPEGYRAVVLLPVGVPAYEPKTPPRKEMTEIAFKDKWDK